MGAGLRMWRPLFVLSSGYPKQFCFYFQEDFGTQKEFRNWSNYFNINISPSMIIISRLKTFFNLLYEEDFLGVLATLHPDF